MIRGTSHLYQLTKQVSVSIEVSVGSSWGSAIVQPEPAHRLLKTWKCRKSDSKYKISCIECNWRCVFVCLSPASAKLFITFSVVYCHQIEFEKQLLIFSWKCSFLLRLNTSQLLRSLLFNVKPGFHIVAECRWRSFAVFGVSGSLEIPPSRWRSFSVVDSLSWSLVVFQSLHLNCYFWRPT